MRDGDFRGEHAPYRLDLTNISRVDGTTKELIGQTLSDEQIVTLGNYVQAKYGNPAGKVTLEQVTTLRRGGAPSNLTGLARGGMIVGLLALLLLFLWWRGRKRD